MSELVMSYPSYHLIKPTTIITASDNKQEFKYNYYKKYLLDNVNLSDATIEGYRVCLNQFILWLKDNNIKNPTEINLKEYVKHLKDSNYTTGTKNQYIRAVKHLFKWLAKNKLYPNIAEDIKGFRDTKKVKKDAFTEQDIIKILNDIDTTTITGKRDKAIFLLTITGGLRATEIHNINIEDIEIKNSQYIINIKGKGHQTKDDYIKIIDPVYDAIQDYLNTRDIKDKKEPLFISASNRTQNLKAESQRITKESLSQIFKKRFRDSGYDSKKLSLHSLRHSTATIFLKASDNNIYRVQQHLRHQDPKTTEIYINLNNKEQETAEQDIYNQIFNQDKQQIINDIKKELNSLSDADLKGILDKIKDIKGGGKDDK